VHRVTKYPELLAGLSYKEAGGGRLFPQTDWAFSPTASME